ncbi:MAG: sensor histidine kinase [Acidimicrobiales bacterium]
MTKIVEDLLFVTVQSEAADGHLQQLVHLDDVLFDEAELLRPGEPVSIHVGDIQPVDVMGSSNHLRRAVRNVAENAVRHALSLVECELRPEADFAIARIIDDGVGIAPEDRETVFERFVRLDAGRSRAAGGTGLGLGLAIAKQIVESHGGDIKVTETPGGGATFTMRLPRADDTDAQNSFGRASGGVTSNETVNGAGRELPLHGDEDAVWPRQRAYHFRPTTFRL